MKRALLVVSTILSFEGMAQADVGSGPPEAPPPVSPAAPSTSDAPYTPPFAFRPTGAGTGVRSETTYGLNAGVSSTVVQYLTGSYSFLPHFSAYVRAGWVDFLPDTGTSGTAFTNVMVGALWAGRIVPSLRFDVAVGSGLPVGQGGGDSPDAGQAAAIAAGNLARSRFDGSTMFSPNDFAPYVGGDIAWVANGLTVQAELNFFELVRARGAESDPDATKTTMSTGLLVGYSILPLLSFAVEVRDGSYLSTPSAVAAGKTSRSWVTVGGGPRLNLQVSRDVWIRPALAFFQPLADPSPTVSAASYHMFLLDVPVSF